MSSTSLLTISAKHATESIEEYIQRLLKTQLAEGVLIGLSGGIDSAVLATLAVRALGKERVHVYYLYDRDSGKESQRRACLVANWLGLELKLHNIELMMRQRRIYAPLIMRIISLSGFVNRYLASNLYRFFYGEAPFISTLRRDSFTGYKPGKSFYNCTVRYVEAAFNARHIYRREFLEKLAKEQNWLLLGAANRSEYLVGWFVKDGIDLYKTQVRQLADYLNLPFEVQNQQPSPDMAKGITDELAIGISYTDLDIILDGFDCNLPDKKISEAGVTRSQISHVHRLNQLSAWKRASEHHRPPVDGGAGGGFRIQNSTENQTLNQL
jgi:NAD+ synthase